MSYIPAMLAKQVVVTVGHNTTTNATAVFDPAEIFAELNDTVIFNCTSLPILAASLSYPHFVSVTLGNHTVTQSTFSSPCTPAHDINVTLNGFDSGFRDTVNGTAITILSVPITPDIANKTLWFFDYNTCAQGGVGGININDSTTETLAGFAVSIVYHMLVPLRLIEGKTDSCFVFVAQRNAIRLNGTGLNQTTSTPSSSHSVASPLLPTQTSTGSPSNGQREVALGGLSVLPLILAAFALAL